MREYIDKRDDRTAAFNQPATEINPCDIATLVILFFAELCKLNK